jgi:hypothetical protein
MRCCSLRIGDVEAKLIADECSGAYLLAYLQRIHPLYAHFRVRLLGVCARLKIILIYVTVPHLMSCSARDLIHNLMENKFTLKISTQKQTLGSFTS